jgi:hypothetical protein
MGSFNDTVKSPGASVITHMSHLAEVTSPFEEEPH